MFRPHVPRLLSQVPTVATHGAGSVSHVRFGTSSGAKGASEVPRSTSLANFGTPDVAAGATEVPLFANHAEILRSHVPTSTGQVPSLRGCDGLLRREPRAMALPRGMTGMGRSNQRRVGHLVREARNA